jgi:hypothetical protein
MNQTLLCALAKYAEDHKPLAIRANDLFGSTGYALGAGNANVPASTVLTHSILPYLIRTGVGAGIGLAAGQGAVDLLEDGALGLLTPEGGEEGAIGPWGSEQITTYLPTVTTFLGSTTAQNMGLKKDFVQGVRDSIKFRTPGVTPWSAARPPQGTSAVRLPWSPQ